MSGPLPDLCIMCGAVVEWPDFTSLCNRCENDNLEYANREEPEL